MSSVLRAIASPLRGSKFDNISTASYYDDDLDQRVPVPFSVQNGALDITLTNSDVEDFVNNGTSPNDDTRYQAKMMGGFSVVTSIGPNFNTYLRKRIEGNDGLGSPYSGPLVIVVNPVMTKVQMAQPNNVPGLEFENVYGINDQAPSSDEYVGGGVSNSYYTSWVFYRPITIRYVSPASTTGYRYITFSTHYDGD
jgi:hypothetical protein